MENSAKILLLGQTGSGKSSFINYFLGKEVAETCAGLPCTPELTPYEMEDGRYPIIIFDSKGLEALEAQNQIDGVIKEIRKRNGSGDLFNWFHTIFYCVSATRRFEEFEANFIDRLQREISQHIHIIITHCDAVSEDTVRHYRETIMEKLNGGNSGIEIFEVVSITKKKRNGKVAEPYGKEAISARVFDLLLEDISYKLSTEYAKSLQNSLITIVERLRYELKDFIEKMVKPKTLIKIIRDDDSVDLEMDRFFEDAERSFEFAKRVANSRLNEILRPATQLYASYLGTVTDSFAESAELDFDNALDWLGDVDIDFSDTDIMRRIAPSLMKGGYIDDNGDFNEDMGIGKMIMGIGAGIKDLLTIKERLLDMCDEMCNSLSRTIPSETEMQRNAQEMIISYIKEKSDYDNRTAIFSLAST